jgi:hypothetical protein
MPRSARSHLVVLLLALPLASCLHEVTTCSTCPPDASSRIEVFVPRTALMDSVQAMADGGPWLTVRRRADRDQRGAIEGLRRGSHDVTVVRWFSEDRVASSDTSRLQIVLEQGETRVIAFHNDFPLVTWSLPPTPGAAGRLAADGPAARRPSRQGRFASLRLAAVRLPSSITRGP